MHDNYYFESRRSCGEKLESERKAIKTVKNTLFKKIPKSSKF